MRKTAVLICIFVLLVCSCKDEKPSPTLPDPAAPTIEFTRIKTADATLQASYISTTLKEHQIGTYTTFQGIAQAQFFDSYGKIAHPKSIICEGYILEEGDGVYSSQVEDPQGIDFGSTTNWQITGNGDIPSFNKEVANKVPEIGDINIRDSINSRDSAWLKINLQSAFTFLGNIDSVNFVISGKQHQLRYNISSPNDSIGLSPKDLKSIGAGKIYVKVEAYRIEVEKQQGYTVAYINKGMFYKSLWLY